MIEKAFRRGVTIFKKINFFVLCVILLSSSFGKISWLRVKGKYIVDEKGKPYRLYGFLIRPTLMWSDREYQNLLRNCGGIYDISLYARNLGFNAVVLEPCGPKEKMHLKYKIHRDPTGKHPARVEKNWLPPVWWQYPPKQYVEKIVTPQVEEAKRAGMYVILDLHMGRWDLESMYRWGLPFWVEVAKKYKNDPYLAIYILYCETILWPRDAEDAGCGYQETRIALNSALRKWYMDVIREIRKLGDYHIVGVSSRHGGYVPEAIVDTWGPVNFKPDLPYNQVVFKQESWIRFDRVDTMIKYMEKYDVPFIWTHMETPPPVHYTAMWTDRLINEKYFYPAFFAPDLRPTFYLPHEKIISKYTKEYVSPPPPPYQPKKKKNKIIVTLKAKNANGGKFITLKKNGKPIKAVYFDKDAVEGSTITFILPKILPPDNYEVEIEVYSEGGPSYPQGVYWINSEGNIILKDYTWEHGFTYEYSNIIPLYYLGDGWHNYKFKFPAYEGVKGVCIKKKGFSFMYAARKGPTRPISKIIIRRWR